MSVAVATLVEDHELPEEFLSLLPLECSSCGCQMVISETLTNLHCSNPRCGSKVQQRIKAICSDLNILQFGESRIADFIETYDIINPMDIFDLRDGMLVGRRIGADLSRTIISQILDIKANRPFLLWEALKVQNIPGIRDTAQKLLGGYRSIDDFYTDLRDGGIEFVDQLISGRSSDSDEIGIRAVQVYKTLIEYEDDIREGIGYLNIDTDSSVPEVTVVVSDQVGGRFSTKNEFYDFCKREFAGKYHFNFASSVSKKSTQCLVWMGADGTMARETNKVTKTQRYNEDGAGIPIVTGEQFVEFFSSDGKIEDLYNWSLDKNLAALAEAEYAPLPEMSDFGVEL